MVTAMPEMNGADDEVHNQKWQDVCSLHPVSRIRVGKCGPLSFVQRSCALDKSTSIKPLKPQGEWQRPGSPFQCGPGQFSKHPTNFRPKAGASISKVVAIEPGTNGSHEPPGICSANGELWSQPRGGHVVPDSCVRQVMSLQTMQMETQLHEPLISDQKWSSRAETLIEPPTFQ